MAKNEILSYINFQARHTFDTIHHNTLQHYSSPPSPLPPTPTKISVQISDAQRQ